MRLIINKELDNINDNINLKIIEIISTDFLNNNLDYFVYKYQIPLIKFTDTGEIFNIKNFKSRLNNSLAETVIIIDETDLELLFNNKYNESGQVKINYTGLTSVNFSENIIKTLDTNLATPTIVSSPTTIYPNSTPNNYKGIFDNTRGSSPIGRFIENPIDGQVHVWRVQVLYSNKGVSNNGSLDIIITNPVSGFQYVMPFTLPSGRTTGILNLNAITIADQVSIPSPQGYILQAQTSFSDNNLIIEIISITRISEAIETKI